MTKTLSALRAQVQPALHDFLQKSVSDVGSISGWTDDVISRLDDYSSRGKLVRGSLVGFGEMLFSGISSPAAIDLGVAMELLQTFLLIHDDIMDDDDVRRGGPSIHAQYRDALEEKEDVAHYGTAQGICVGDVAAFLALYRIATTDVSAPIKAQIDKIVSLEIVRVGLAQMQDVYHGWVDDAPVEAILEVYTYKTGRYTFSLPLALGAILAGQPENTVADLSVLGESLGRIFQIRDDELGMFGDESKTGKPSGSDVRENKKTLLRAMLNRHCHESDNLRRLFGKKDLTESELATLKERFNACGARDAVEEIVATEAARSRNLIEQIAQSDRSRGMLESLLGYNLDRSV